MVSIIIYLIDKITLICLRLPLGVYPSPEQYTVISQEVMYIINDFPMNPLCNSHTLYYPNRKILLPVKYLYDIFILVIVN